MLKQIIKYFLQGLLYSAPVAIIVYVIVRIFVSIGEAINDLGLTIHPLLDPLLGLLVFAFLIIIIGIIGGSLVFRPLFSSIENVIEKAPVIKFIYTSTKDVMNAFVGSKKRFNQPVLVKLNRSDDIERLGFVTQQDLTEIGIKKDKVAVYLPFSYAISGNLYIVPRENITLVNASATDIMKFIVSGGVTDIDKEENHLKR